MKEKLKIVKAAKHLDWIELVLIFCKDNSFDAEKFENLHTVFPEITVLSTESRHILAPEYVKWSKIDDDLSSADMWNQKVQSSKKDWLLFLEYEEDLDINSLPNKENVHFNEWIPTLFIHSTGPETFRQYYQIRLVPKSDQPIFGGKNIPDATKFIYENNVSLSSVPIKINRYSPKMSNIDPDEELSIHNFSPQIYLQLGHHYYEQRKYILAAAQYRRLLKMKYVLPFDRLAAFNGLAGCFVETYKWEKAIDMTVKSIECEPIQFLPYLIQYRIFQLNKQWFESLQALEQYYHVLSQCSKANYDKYISREETLLKLGKLSINTGSKDKALQYYENYYYVKNGEVEDSFLDMLLVLSIEQNNYEKSIYFFNEIFGRYIPDKLSKEMQGKLNDFLSMFMVNGWYDYTFEIYDLLYEEDSQNSEYRRRLIVTLTKTNRIDKAKKLIASNI